MANRGASGTGGSGGAWKGTVRLKEGWYRLTVGEGGYGYAGGLNATPPSSRNGYASAFAPGGGTFYKYTGTAGTIYLLSQTPAVNDIVFHIDETGNTYPQPFSFVSYVSGTTVMIIATDNQQYTGTGKWISQDPDSIIQANGGMPGRSAQYSSSAGTGGSVRIYDPDSVIVSTTYSIQGTTGNTAGINATAQGVYTISGHTWGGTGNASGSAGGGGCSPSYHGYGSLVFKSAETAGKLYKGSQLIKNINHGSDNIKYVYKGSDLIWQRIDYQSGKVMVESNTPGDKYLWITTPGIYELTLIGGGGGSSGSGGGGGGSATTTKVDAIAGS